MIRAVFLLLLLVVVSAFVIGKEEKETPNEAKDVLLQQIKENESEITPYKIIWKSKLWSTTSESAIESRDFVIGLAQQKVDICTSSVFDQKNPTFRESTHFPEYSLLLEIMCPRSVQDLFNDSVVEIPTDSNLQSLLASMRQKYHLDEREHASTQYTIEVQNVERIRDLQPKSMQADYLIVRLSFAADQIERNDLKFLQNVSPDEIWVSSSEMKSSLLRDNVLDKHSIHMFVSPINVNKWTYYENDYISFPEDATFEEKQAIYQDWFRDLPTHELNRYSWKFLEVIDFSLPLWYEPISKFLELQTLPEHGAAYVVLFAPYQDFSLEQHQRQLYNQVGHLLHPDIEIPHGSILPRHILSFRMQDLSEQELREVFRSSHAFVQGTPTGNALHLLRAMLTELPVIATRWGSHSPVYSDSTGYPVAYNIVNDENTLSPTKLIKPAFQTLQLHMVKAMNPKSTDDLRLHGLVGKSQAERFVNVSKVSNQVKQRFNEIYQMNNNN
mmetsp:Transcript_8397/g.12769  ORF Transcript_8397/g.12769 Transcript_8397/m.12769 type:complete len:499 (+) Transcript_8397:82-1578(+)